MTKMIENRIGRAANKTMVLDKVLIADDRDRFCFNYRSPNRVGAFDLFLPTRPRTQRYFGQLFAELRLSPTADDDAVGIRQN